MDTSNCFVLLLIVAVIDPMASLQLGFQVVDLLSLRVNELVLIYKC